jgi:hypothetical protein
VLDTHLACGALGLDVADGGQNLGEVLLGQLLVLVDQRVLGLHLLPSIVVYGVDGLGVLVVLA